MSDERTAPLQVELYAHRIQGSWRHLYPTLAQLHLCGEEPACRVRVTEDPYGGYWAWKDVAEDGDRLSMIYPDRRLVEICFPYGPDVEEKAGRGKVVRVRIEEVPMSEGVS